MTFPATPRLVTTEIYINGVWTDISSDVQSRDVVDISRGKTEYASQAAPSRTTLTLNNRLGKYSPRNPLGAYYGQIGRNTPLRTGFAAPALVFDELTTSDEYISTPDSVALSITGDIDVRIDLSVDDLWVPGVGTTRTLIGKWEGVGVRSWHLRLSNTGLLGLVWVDSTAVTHVVDATVPLPAFPLTGRRALRAALDVNNGAAGNTVTFYTADTSAGPWTVLDTITTAGTTDIFDSTAPVKVGAVNALVAPYGAVLSAEVRNSIDGTLVGNPIFTTATAGASTLTDAQGNTWTVGNGATLENSIHANIRGWGEIASLPPRWDTSGNDAYVPIEVAGLLRRLGQGVDPADSGLRVFTLASDGLLNYWPLSGAAGTTYSLDVGGTQTGTARFYSEGGLYQYGESLGSQGNYLGTGMAYFAFSAAGGLMRFDAPHSNTSEALDFIWQSNDLGDFTIWLEDQIGDTWELNLNGSTGLATVTFNDPALIPVDFPAVALPEIRDGLVHHTRLQMLRNGADTDWSLYVDGVLATSGTQAGHNVSGCVLGRVLHVQTGASEQQVDLAHITVWTDTTVTWPAAVDCVQAAFGYIGETAGTRIQRICGLSSIPLQVVGDLTDTTPMGAQHPEGVLTQLADAEKTDLGILTEPRDLFGLQYRTRSSLYNQAPALTLQYDSGQVAPPFEPVDDDQLTHNDITVTRRDGDSYRTTKASGVLSILDPPNGVGRYRDEVEVNVETDGQLAGIGSWLLSIGTWDESRYPSITVDLANPDTVAAGLAAAALSVDIGDVIVIQDADHANIYDDITVLVLGYRETLNTFEHRLTFNCVPAAPYDVAVYGSGVGTGPDRYDTDGSELSSGVTSSATSLTVLATGTTVWTTTAGEFPFDIRVGGERMTVTNITSATSPQTFTVTRAVNGVVKAHSAGADVALWSTPRYAL